MDGIAESVVAVKKGGCVKYTEDVAATKEATLSMEAGKDDSGDGS